MKQGVEDFRALGLSQEAYEKASWRNADRILGLGLAEKAGAASGKKAA